MAISKFCSGIGIIGVLAVLLALAGCDTVKKEAGFDDLCKIFTEMKNSNMTLEQQREYLDKNVKKRITSIEVIQFYSVIPQADPADRYSLMKQSAEYTLKRSWDCAAAKELMEVKK